MTISRYSAETLDLSRLIAPVAIQDIDYENILAERKTRLIELFDALEIPYDVGELETDPAIILEETDAYRELLMYARVNDAVRAVMVAFAIGSDLDHLAAFYGVVRLVITPATDSIAAVMEGNTAFRRRVLLAPEAFAAAGPRGAYIYHALTADSRVLNADVWSPSPGAVVVAIQSREGDGSAPDDLVSAVRTYINQDHIKSLTDYVTVQSVANHLFSIDLDAYVMSGPDISLIKSEIIASINAMVLARRTPSRDMPRSAIIAAAHIGSVDKVILTNPTLDIAHGYGEVALLEDLVVRVTRYDG